MDEWQPVRIATPEQVRAKVPGHYIVYPYPAGKIIRVRPATTLPLCGFGREFEVHPDDWHIIGVPSWASQVAICEAQILAD